MHHDQREVNVLCVSVERSVKYNPTRLNVQFFTIESALVVLLSVDECIQTAVNIRNDDHSLALRVKTRIRMKNKFPILVT